MTVEVRRATVDDVEAIRAVAEASWYAAYGGFLEPSTVEAGLAENYDPDLLAAAVDHDEVAVFVAVAADGDAEVDRDAGDVVGFASAEQTWADEVELHALYVHPDRWGEGTGSALLTRVGDWAAGRDVDRIACAVFADNSVGEAFIESAGFERVTEAAAEVAGELHDEYEWERPL